MTEPHEGTNASWTEAEKMTRALEFLDRTDVKAAVAALVGILSLIGLTVDGTAYMKVVAGVVGVLFPVGFFTARHWRKVHRDEVIRNLDEVKANRKRESGG